jgi:hypothetical protein
MAEKCRVDLENAFIFGARMGACRCSIKRETKISKCQETPKILRNPSDSGTHL